VAARVGLRWTVNGGMRSQNGRAPTYQRVDE
jgi:hypothetical protein